MPTNTLPIDNNSKPAEGLFDPTTGHVVAGKSGTVATTGGGTEYAPATVNIADPTTPTSQLAVNSLGQIAVSNFPSTQSVIGTVSVAQFPSVQPISGSIDTTDRSSRQLGHVVVDLGGAGTNTAPGYAVIQDPTTNSHKMAVNSDGSLNVGLVSGGGIELIDSGGTNKATINSAGQVQTEDIEQSGYVSLTSPPANTNVASDTALTFSSQVNRAILQNNTSATVNCAFDVAASAGSLAILPGTLLIYPKKCTVLHLYTAAAQAVNGTVAGNIVVLGAL